MFQGFDGLMTLSRREGVDIRPTLLRVLTDLYVQTASHTREEDEQFIELASRLIDEVDDATRAAVRARLSVYPGTPRDIRRKLSVPPPRRAPIEPPAAAPSPLHLQSPSESHPPLPIPAIGNVQSHASMPSSLPARAPTLALRPGDATQLNEMFNSASSRERAKILLDLDSQPLKPSMRVDSSRAARAVETFEAAAMASDAAAFTSELADALILPIGIAANLVNDKLGEPLACAMKVVGMPADRFQRVLLFLDPERGKSVMDVYRLARLYDTLSERAALIMLAAWRGSATAVTRAKYRPALHDDERQRARPMPVRQTVQPASDARPGIVKRDFGSR